MEVRKPLNNQELELKEVERKLKEIKTFMESTGIDLSGERDVLEAKKKSIMGDLYENLDPWQKVQIARHKNRPNYEDYIKGMLTSFMEFHGDRYYGDDGAIVGGVGYFEGIPVTLISHAKGKDTSENIKRNFGSPYPEGYRKSLRLMKQAEKFHRPIICLIDTQGAYCGIGAEERGQGEAIARNLLELSDLNTPIISVVIGEGGSGGALALGVGDRVLMLENAIYSVISPEGCASILMKDSTRANEAAKVLKLTSEDLLEFGIIDEIIKEPVGGAHLDGELTVTNVKAVIHRHLLELMDKNQTTLVEERYNKIRDIGVVLE